METCARVGLAFGAVDQGTDDPAETTDGEGPEDGFAEEYPDEGARECAAHEAPGGRSTVVTGRTLLVIVVVWFRGRGHRENEFEEEGAINALAKRAQERSRWALIRKRDPRICVVVAG